MKAYKGGKKEKEREDYKRNHGRTSEGAFIEGIRDYIPCDHSKQALPVAYNYQDPTVGEITVYDGSFRMVDKSVFDKDVNVYRKRQKMINELVDSFLDTGDNICLKYIGQYYFWLKQNKPDGDNFNLFVQFIQSEGFNNTTAKSLATALQSYDGTPDFINSQTNPGEKFTQGIRKLQWVLRFCGIVFVGKNGMVGPDTIRNEKEDVIKPPNPSEAAMNELKQIKPSLFKD